jgi:hypothetical protein
MVKKTFLSLVLIVTVLHLTAWAQEKSNSQIMAITQFDITSTQDEVIVDLSYQLSRDILEEDIFIYVKVIPQGKKSLIDISMLKDKRNVLVQESGTVLSNNETYKINPEGNKGKIHFVFKKWVSGIYDINGVHGSLSLTIRELGKAKNILLSEVTKNNISF